VSNERNLFSAARYLFSQCIEECDSVRKLHLHEGAVKSIGKKIGIALGSGSARGWSHIGGDPEPAGGGIPIDFTCGASVGALVAGSYAAGFIDPLDRWVRKLSWSHIIGFMDVMIPRSGLVEGEKISGYLRGSSPTHDRRTAGALLRRSDRSQTVRRSGSVKDRSSMPSGRAFHYQVFHPLWKKRPVVGGRGTGESRARVTLRAMGADIVIAVNLNSDIMGKPKVRRMADPPEQ